MLTGNELMERTEETSGAGELQMQMDRSGLVLGSMAGEGDVAAQAGRRAGEPVTVAAGEEKLALQVLVVDDDAPVRRACRDIAAGQGCAVTEAGSVPEAQAILKHQRVDLLLLDLRLPGGSGLALLEQVKMLHPETTVVVMTAFATVGSAVEAMRIGASDY